MGGDVGKGEVEGDGEVGEDVEKRRRLMWRRGEQETEREREEERERKRRGREGEGGRERAQGERKGRSPLIIFLMLFAVGIEGCTCLC